MATSAQQMSSEEKKNIKVLIVEDEVVIGLDLQSKLQSLGYVVPQVIRYGEQVEEAVVSEKPDLILMDIHLKGEMTGTDAGRLISGRHIVPIVFLTAFSDEATVTAAKSSNPYGFLKKPVNLDSLRVTIDITLYKAQMEQKLRRSEEKFRRIYENSVAGIYQSTAAGQFIMVNQAFAEMIGYRSPEAVIEQTTDIGAQLYVEPDDRRRFISQIDQQGSVENFEFSFHHADGSKRWLNVSSHAVHDDKDEFLYYEGVAIDVTERKRMELQLQKNEKFLNDVFDSVQDGINVLDRDLRIVKTNKLMERQYADQMPLVGKKCYAAFQQRDSICPDCPSVKAMETGKIQHLEMEVPYPDGMTPKGWIELYAYPLMEDDRVTGVIEYGRNITERKQAEFELQNNYMRLKEILNSIDANVYVADFETCEILFMNQRMIDEFGEDMTGKTCWESLRHEPVLCHDCPRDKLLNEQGEPNGSYSWEYHHLESGKQLILNDRAIRWIDGRMAHLQIATDITKFKKMERELRQKFKMEALGVLAGGVAHNFNNNLAIILGNIEMAQIKKSDFNAAENYLNSAKTAIFRSRDLVRQILTYSRQGAHDMSSIRIEGIVEETLKLLSVTLPSTINLQLTKKQDMTDVTIHADFTQIQEALLNLCNNAAQAMDGGGDLNIELQTVTFSAEDLPVQSDDCSGGLYAMLSVKDSGCGMDQETLNKIFDPFFTTKEVGQGTGMGLSTVKGIMDLHNGWLKVRSVPEKGSVFELYFPVVEQEEKARVGESIKLSPGTENILLVDDDDALIDILKQVLTEQGYSVSALTDSQAALKQFTADPDHFDLVISDQTMPGLTGLELIARMKQIRPDLPSIICTGFSDGSTEEKARELGVEDFLLKPLDLPGLTRTIRAALKTDRGFKSRS
ncbi:MAG: response regulator [Desulfuromonadales bacterium]|nr:response regulator [Desulfuromonadales bacterium]MBN2791727.1 response regulator [Desulfuromonadales bacterium]